MTTEATATKVAFDEKTHEYDYPRQQLFKLSVAILGAKAHLLVSQSHPHLKELETAVFLADKVGNIISHTEVDMIKGHVDHEEMIKRSPYKLID